MCVLITALSEDGSTPELEKRPSLDRLDQYFADSMSEEHIGIAAFAFVTNPSETHEYSLYCSHRGAIDVTSCNSRTCFRDNKNLLQKMLQLSNDTVDLATDTITMLDPRDPSLRTTYSLVNEISVRNLKNADNNPTFEDPDRPFTNFFIGKILPGERNVYKFELELPPNKFNFFSLKSNLASDVSGTTFVVNGINRIKDAVNSWDIPRVSGIDQRHNYDTLFKKVENCLIPEKYKIFISRAEGETPKTYIRNYESIREKKSLPEISGIWESRCFEATSPDHTPDFRLDILSPDREYQPEPAVLK